LQVWVNLGSLHLARGEANDAARMYAAALSRFYQNKDPKVSVWVARAYYDAKDAKACKRALLKAIHSFPDDQALHFNLAVTMQHSAQEVRFHASTNHTSNELAQAHSAYIVGERQLCFELFHPNEAHIGASE
jgi:hypothetical protein